MPVRNFAQNRCQAERIQRKLWQVSAAPREVPLFPKQRFANGMYRVPGKPCVPLRDRCSRRDSATRDSLWPSIGELVRRRQRLPVSVDRPLPVIFPLASHSSECGASRRSELLLLAPRLIRDRQREESQFIQAREGESHVPRQFGVPQVAHEVRHGFRCAEEAEFGLRQRDRTRTSSWTSVGARNAGRIDARRIRRSLDAGGTAPGLPTKSSRTLAPRRTA